MNLMQAFLSKEKNIFSIDPQRIAVDQHNQQTGGARFAPYTHESAYGPEKAEAFSIKGIWLPEASCTALAAMSADIPASFKKQTDRGVHFLFLVHPESETLFQPLLQRFHHTLQEFQAISLSSVRTLLVDIPDGAGKPTSYFVKLSLNLNINGTVRTVSEKECASSLGNAATLRNLECAGITFMNDLCAFVPTPDGIDPSAVLPDNKAAEDRFGMIVREVPPFLFDSESHIQLIPFFALFHDNGWLEHMVNRSGLTATGFLQQYLLQPYAKVFVELLFFRHISIQAHGQNFLWQIDTDTGLPRQFMYRDMGGVNMLLTPENKKHLPESLTKPGYYYQSTHIQDAADAIETHWVISVLFNLTKRIVRSRTLREGDAVLGQWYESMSKGGYLGNWTSSDERAPYRHDESIPEKNFICYGYVEDLFKQALLTEITARGIDEQLAGKYAYLDGMIREYKDSSNETREWFRPLIHTLYSHWLAFKGIRPTETFV